MSDQISKLEASDAELIERAQSGDSDAFGELWKRHYRSAARVARQFTSSIDADDLVSEAYARIYQRILAGGGPTGGFRPYLYTTIRNLAASWGTSESRSVNVEVIEDLEDERIPDDPAAWALDRTLTARAFRTLPERWQTVLWYTEVEGMDPHEVAPIMGMTANGVAALSYRAREGLRTAWLQAHISDATSSGECRWTIARLGSHARNSLTEREQTRLEAHLVGCAKCTIISEEVEEVGSHLALVLVPLTLGGVAGGALLSQLSAGGAMATEAVPALPASIASLGGGSVVATAAGTGIASSVGVPALIGGIAIVAALGTSVAIGPSSGSPEAASVPTSVVSTPSTQDIPSPGTTVATIPDGAAVAGPGSANGTVDGLGSTVDGATSGLGLGSTVSGVTSGVGSTVSGVTSGVGSTVSGVTSGVGSTVSGVTSGVGSTVSGVTSGVGSTVGGVTSGVGSAVGGSLGGTVSGTGSSVGGAVGGTGSAVGGAVSGTGSAVGGAVSGTGSAVGGAVGGVGGSAGGLLGGSGH